MGAFLKNDRSISKHNGLRSIFWNTLLFFCSFLLVPWNRKNKSKQVFMLSKTLGKGL
jgi:hypothetical protein